MHPHTVIGVELSIRSRKSFLTETKCEVSQHPTAGIPPLASLQRFTWHPFAAGQGGSVCRVLLPQQQDSSWVFRVGLLIFTDVLLSKQ